MSTLSGALEKALAAGRLSLAEFPAIKLDVPPSPSLGDFSSDLPLALARVTRQTPLEIAEALTAHMDVPSALIERVEIAGSGFLNFYLKPGWLQEVVREARAQGQEFGRSTDLGNGEAVLIEFVSAHPTGPLTVTHGRGAALGDVVANLLEWSGYRVSREFYVNDAGSQMDRFGRSLEARYLQAAGQSEAQVPVDGYPDPYVIELAKNIQPNLPAENRRATLARLGRDAVVANQRETLDRFGVRFDQWYYEHDLQEGGKLAETLDLLRANGHAEEIDGALWLRTTRLGDTEDRPLLRSNGRPTYLAGDLAYHRDKFARGFTRLIDVWGAEHVGYIPRTRAGIQALGADADALEILIFQPVTLRIDGMLVEGSAAIGNNILLNEVIDAVGADTARFFYLSRSTGSALEFDLDLARRQSDENPAHLVRSTAARLRTQVEEARAAGTLPGADADLSGLSEPEELALIRQLSEFPDEVRAAAREREPARLVRLAREIAAAVPPFEKEYRVHGVGPSPAQAAVLEAAAVVLENTLAILGISPA